MTIWTKTDNGYVTEMSTLEHTGMKCAVCQTFFTLDQPLRDKSGEIIKWTYKCKACGAFMQIFND